MKLSALDRKLLRDLWRLRGQVLTIAAVVASGIATFVTMRSTLDSIVLAMDRTYAEQRMADLFVRLERAPESVAREIREIPGVERVDARIVADVQLVVQGDSITGRLVSVEAADAPQLLVPFVRVGRLPEAGTASVVEVAVNEGFAEARGLLPGDTFEAIALERSVTLRVVGIVTSPESIAAIAPGAFIPDDMRFGIAWLPREVLASLYDMEGAFNDLVLTYARDARPAAVVREVDAIVDPYGGLGAVERKDQLSHWFLSSEISQLATLATILPTIFLGVAMFLFAMVLGRLISQSRAEIAVLKSFGYGRWAIAEHFGKLTLVVAALATALGLAAGVRMGEGMLGLYARFYRFPTLEQVLHPRLLLVAGGLAVGAAVIGALGALRRAMDLAPAEAMRPPSPPLYRATFVERLGLGRHLPLTLRVVLRSIERSPSRSLTAVLGVAAGGTLLLSGLSMLDSIERLIDREFRVGRHEDLSANLAAPRALGTTHEFERLPGVLDAEPYRLVPARLRSDGRVRTLAIEGRTADSYMRPLLDADGSPFELSTGGLALTDTVADILRVRAGDVVNVEVLEGERRSLDVPVSEVYPSSVGLGARMSIERLSALVGDAPSMSAVDLRIDPNQREALDAELARSPLVAGSAGRLDMLREFERSTAENMAFMSFFLVLFAAVLVGGVIYNNARIALAERGRDLASMRVLGYRQGEVAGFLVGELAVLTVAAVPGALVGGYGLALLVMHLMDTELFSLQLYIAPASYVRTTLVILAAAALASLLVARRLARLDLVDVLKTRA